MTFVQHGYSYQPVTPSHVRCRMIHLTLAVCCDTYYYISSNMLLKLLCFHYDTNQTWTLSHEKKCPPEEDQENPFPQRPFKAAHDSFRLRMFQEQHGFEPAVFMTKKRTRDNKSVMSEFKGGDLNKYTSKTYAIQNGNEVFGDCLLTLIRFRNISEELFLNTSNA
ncbi:hypothetical protein DICVIV_11988 [Dictyocaulus viviparus]|uniref:Uncharacterized protein n=1 Tax=Dictyocaulus viviparus TaxID=29172 RepID=A0A0D8XBR1_DICVI|nr:hypothetical protein DICVIV_11988 [Dictyocaulus viviparus]